MHASMCVYESVMGPCPFVCAYVCVCAHFVYKCCNIFRPINKKCVVSW